nr:MAG TPA: hypothetical protein [Caudoviricetes sp.]
MGENKRTSRVDSNHISLANLRSFDFLAFYIPRNFSGPMRFLPQRFSLLFIRGIVYFASVLAYSNLFSVSSNKKKEPEFN